MTKRARCRKHKVRYPDEFELISEYYNKALEQLSNSGGRIGHKIIHSMPVELYDLSIDILYNSNEEFSNQGLRKLIEKVNNIIDGEPDEDFESNLNDNYNNLY